MPKVALFEIEFQDATSAINKSQKNGRRAKKHI